MITAETQKPRRLEEQGRPFNLAGIYARRSTGTDDPEMAALVGDARRPLSAAPKEIWSRRSPRRGSLRPLIRLSLGLVVLGTLPAVAASGTDLTLFGKDPGQDRAFACYTRAYDPAHLKAHRQQNVTQMMVLIDSAYDSESQARTYGLMMGVHFRKLNSQFEAGGGCSSTIDGKALLNCGIECDGGRIDVRVKDANRILVDVPDGAFTWNADAQTTIPRRGRISAPMTRPSS
jgi:hypothetical protein